MGWIASSTHEEGRFSRLGLGADLGSRALVDLNDAAVMPRGTLVVETRMSPNGRPQQLFGYEVSHPYARAFSLQAIPGGGVAMILRHADDIVHAALRFQTTGRADVIRLTYAWDAPAGWGRLSLERPDEATVQSVDVAHPKPLSASDLRSVMLKKGPRVFSKDVVFAAVSCDVEPVGPSPTLCPETLVATPLGYRCAGDLRRGDTVVSARGRVVPVLHSVARRVPSLGSFRPIRLRAPYLGLQQDVRTAPDQRLILRGSDVEYLFGQEAVLVPARHLVTGFAASFEDCGPLSTYVQLVLPEHDGIVAAGALMESLYLGRLRRKPDAFAASILAHVPRHLVPEHGTPVFPVLRSFEAVTLIEQRAA